MKAHCYLNDAPDNFFGFKPEHMGKLRFITTLSMDDTRDDTGALEAVFAVGNGADPESDTLWYNNYGARSFSVGDVAVIERDGVFTTYACESMGWTKYKGEPVRVIQISGST